MYAIRSYYGIGLIELASFKRIMFEDFWMDVNEFLVKNIAF